MSYFWTALASFAAGVIVTRIAYNKAISAYKYLENSVKAGLAWIEHLPSELRNKVKAVL